MKNSFKNNNYFNIQPIPLTFNLLEIANMLQDIQHPKIIQLSNKNVKSLLFNGKLPFLENSFYLSAIPFIPYNSLHNLKALNSKKNKDLDSFINLLDSYLNIMIPFDVPILFVNGIGFEGGFCNPIYFVNTKNGEIKKIIFNEFVITNKLSLLTPGIYAHEIIHSQLEFNDGVKNYIHSEVLPIFFDKLTALYANDNYETLKINEKLRFIRLFSIINMYKNKNLSLYHKAKLSMGIISILEAEKLFDRYLYGSNNEKYHIIMMINEILLGDKYIEDLLNNLEIDQDSCQDIKLIRKKITNLS